MIDRDALLPRLLRGEGTVPAMIAVVLYFVALVSWVALAASLVL